VSDPADAFRRATTALAAEAGDRAPQRVNGPEGTFAVVDERWPDSHDSNKVVVTKAVDARELLDFTESSLGGAEVGHRQVLLLAGGPSVLELFGEAGYSVSTVLVMALSEGRPAVEPDPALDVRAVDEPTMREVVRTTWEVGDPDMSRDTVAQLVARRDAYAAPVTSFAAYADEVAVAHADLRSWDGIAEIDSVVTLPDYRNRGYARALVLTAVARARAQHADLVFLLADAEDWPRELYARLGFETVGTIYELHRSLA
jgi:ribosomal protein S18 acetylase RimI-like enzyme